MLFALPIGVIQEVRMRDRIRGMAFVVIGLTMVWLAAAVAMAQTEFSATMVNLQRAENSATAQTEAKIYFGKDKFRIEPMKKDPRAGGAVIVDMNTRTTTMIMDQQHMYMEMPATSQMAAHRNGYDFFRSGDVEDACADWLAQSSNKGGTCHKIGNETVNGRSTVKYEGTNAKGDAETVWLDSKLRFPLKWQGKNNGGELRDIQEGSQPASLFVVPPDYKKFDMGGMMQQRPQ